MVYEFFCSTKSDGKLTSLDQYISRMKKGQKDIFYITETSKEQLEKSPFLERLKKEEFRGTVNSLAIYEKTGFLGSIIYEELFCSISPVYLSPISVVI